jgi:hypothetical protein
MVLGRGRRTGEHSEPQAIAAFWAWWEQAGSEVAAAIAAGSSSRAASGASRRVVSGAASRAVKQLGRRVEALHPELQWELARGWTALHALCVSCAGQGELRALTERWALAAPPADGTWEYHPARQPDPASLHGRLEIDGHGVVPGEARLHVIVDQARALVDVGVHHPGFAGMPEPVMGTVAYLLLDWLLGEDGVERWVGIVTSSAEVPPGTVPVGALPEIVEGLAGRDTEPRWAVLQGEDQDGHPIMAMARNPLKRVEFPLFDLHGAVTVEFLDATPEGMPRPDALERLRVLEDDLDRMLGTDAVLAAHQTSRGRRTFHLYCDQYGAVPGLVAGWRAEHPAERVTVDWDVDGTWEALRPFR